MTLFNWPILLAEIILKTVLVFMLVAAGSAVVFLGLVWGIISAVHYAVQEHKLRRKAGR